MNLVALEMQFYFCPITGITPLLYREKGVEISEFQHLTLTYYIMNIQ